MTPLLLFSAYAVQTNNNSYSYNNTGFCNNFENSDIGYTLEFNKKYKYTYEHPCVVADSIAVNNLISNSFGFDVSSWNKDDDNT
jgi:hypothetical protein